jgi:hypothetical protein
MNEIVFSKVEKKCVPTDDSVVESHGDWSVLGKTTVNSRGNILNLCRCKCGLEKYISKSNLRFGSSKRCINCYSSERFKYVCTKGQEFGKWVTTGDSKHRVPEDKSTEIMWLCECTGPECGGAKQWVQLNGLNTGRSTCCKKCAGPKHSASLRKFNGYYEGRQKLLKSKWFKIKRGAETRGLEFSVSIEHAESLFDGVCALSGVSIYLESPKTGDCTASLDRIDSTKGYIKNNIQWVHVDINFIKQAYDEDYFIQMCRNVANHQAIKQSAASLDQDTFISCNGV